DVDISLGEIVLRHGDVHRQISGRMHRLSDQELVLGCTRDVRPGDDCGAGRRAGAEELASVHASLLLSYWRVPLRKIFSIQLTSSYMITETTESTKTATQTNAIS